VEKKHLLDISAFVKSEGLNDSVFLDNLLEKVGMVNGRYYGLPFLFGPQLLLYRRDLFEDPAICAAFKKKYGTTLHIPRTWFEFNVISSFFTRSINAASPVEYGTSLPSRSDMILLPELLPRIWVYNAKIFDENGRAAVASADFKKGVNNFIETFKFAPPDTLNYSVEDSIQNFYSGNTAMLMSYAAFIVDVNNNAKSKVVGKIGYANIPGNHSVLGSWGLAIPATAKDPTAALKFLSWTSDVEMSRYFTILDGQSPLKNVYTNDELANHYPWLPLIYRTYAGNIQRKSIKSKDGSFVSITMVEALIYQYIMQILRNEISVDAAMAKLSKELNELI
jgi:multiple sugar transport system substrate-binding protein